MKAPKKITPTKLNSFIDGGSDEPETSGVHSNTPKKLSKNKNKTIQKRKFTFTIGLNDDHKINQKTCLVPRSSRSNIITAALAAFYDLEESEQTRLISKAKDGIL